MRKSANDFAPTRTFEDIEVYPRFVCRVYDGTIVGEPSRINITQHLQECCHTWATKITGSRAHTAEWKAAYFGLAAAVRTGRIPEKLDTPLFREAIKDAQDAMRADILHERAGFAAVAEFRRSLTAESLATAAD